MRRILCRGSVREPRGAAGQGSDPSGRPGAVIPQDFPEHRPWDTHMRPERRLVWWNPLARVQSHRQTGLR